MIRTCVLKIRQGRRRDQARLVEVLGLARQLYNAALESRRDAWRKQRLTRSYFDQTKELTELRAQDPSYNDLDATMLRLTSLRRLDLAYKSFFRRVKAGEKPGFPRFKGRDRFDTLVFGTRGWKLTGTKLVVRGVGWFRVTQVPHRQGTPTGLRLVYRAGRWYANVVLDVGAVPAVKQAKNGIGIDVGIKTFATLSDGEQVEHPRFARKAMAELRNVQQALSRKRKGSVRRKKAKRDLVRVHERVTNRRRDFVRQTAAALVKRYDGFAVEALQVTRMVDKERKPPEGLSEVQARGMRRGILDSAWSMFFDALAAKAEEAGMPFVRVNPKGTTQKCSGCGSVVRKGLRDRVHDCAACGLVLDRDENAARNIYDLGWRSAAPAAAENLA